MVSIGSAIFFYLTTIQNTNGELLLILAALILFSVAVIAVFLIKKRTTSNNFTHKSESDKLHDNIRLLQQKLEEKDKELKQIQLYKNPKDQKALKTEDVSKNFKHIQEVREEERRRIAREIHDELGQQLTALKFDLNWIRKRLQPDQEAIAKKASQAMLLIDQTINSVRKISSELRPQILDDLGLIPALEWQCMDFEKRTGVRCHFKSSVPDVEFENEFGVNVFRILQETLTNVARHSGATKAKAEISFEKDIFCMRISDNGAGITDHETENNYSLGIIGMKERAMMYGGELHIQGSKENGTTVMVKIPLPKHGKKLWPEQNETKR
jgi:signal transduction histidine kinase